MAKKRSSKKKKTTARTAKPAAPRKTAKAGGRGKGASAGVRKKSGSGGAARSGAVKKKSTARTSKAKTSRTAKPASKAGKTAKTARTAKTTGTARSTRKAAKPSTRSAASRATGRRSTAGVAAAPASDNGSARKAGMLGPGESFSVNSIATGKASGTARLTRKQLEHFRTMLLRRRAEIVGDVQAMESGALRGGGAEPQTHAPMHMADVGTDTFDQEFTLRLAATEREMLAEIDEALHRIEQGTYGVCEVTGRPITIPRLEAKPWAKVCIEVARERDRFHGMRW